MIHEEVADVPAVQDSALAFAASSSSVPTRISRSAERAPLPNEAAAENLVEGKRFAEKKIDIHTDAKKSSPVLAAVDSGDAVDITGVSESGWSQIMHKGVPRWVDSDELAKNKPKPEPKAEPEPEKKSLGEGECAGGSEVESGLQPDTIGVHRAVCAQFPSIVRYGGVGGGGEHATGRALDIMTSTDEGTEIADFARSHATELGVSEVIWRQRIWTVERGSEGWRPMSSRGSATANHMDHVHVTTYGSSGQ